ncbi:extracellular ligand-binding receptor [Roseibium sp. TrichSKD4]|uniref:penicillin-binding protein activator n=1 Tax=Roseibium sp. TrichSKD4 TaxID=744980 RepID=UPI0001E56EE0|nr:penicillin-binding protein activator [Roseibium sp. TrichSKD4]EFO32195.1 extracellular ligand-binding receptor [Roseibium sp. TrichSKD4]
MQRIHLSKKSTHWFRATCVGAAALMLAACQGSSLGSLPGTSISGDQPPQTSGDVIGTGSVRVGLLLPLSGNSGSQSIGTVFRNSAELALSSFPNADVQLLVKDTGGTVEGGRSAAQSAIAEGAEFILGPIFSPAVSGAATVARSSGVPVVAFSTDTSVASSGVYLLSFLPAGDVKRIIGYAASQQKRSFAALIPDNTYGAVVEASFRQEVGRAGGRIVSIQRYKTTGGDTADLTAKAQSLAASAGQIDALFVPAGGGVPSLVVQTLTAAGANFGNIKILGSGQWDTQQMKSNPVLAGSWYPGPENSGFQTFAGRYKSTYNSVPPRNATLAYDGVTLAAGLVRSAGQQRFSRSVLTNRDGFIGIDGLFRFLSNGQNERGLAVYQMTGSSSQVVSPAPRDFRSAR